VKRVLTIVMAALLLFVAACGGGAGNNQPATEGKATEAQTKAQETTKVAEAATEAAKTEAAETKAAETKAAETKAAETKAETTTAAPEEELTTIRVFVQEMSNPQYPRNWDRKGSSEIRRIAKERFGIQLELDEVIPDRDQFKTIINTRFASGADLPDIIRFDFTAIEMAQLFKAGNIIDMLTVYGMPNTLKTMEIVPTLRIKNCGINGEMLSVPQVVLNPQHITRWMSIRYDWLNELGLEIPTTTDEYLNTLRAFQQNDLNGSGSPDEALITPYNITNQVLGPAFGAFGIQDAQNSWHEENGKVIAAMLTDNARNYVQYMAQLFSEGLIWGQSFNYTNEERMNFVTMNNFAGSFGPFWDPFLWNQDGYMNGRPEEFAIMLPISDGQRPPTILQTNFIGQATHNVTAGSKAPEKAAMLLDWFHSTEGSLIEYYGEVLPGGDYYYVDEKSWSDIGLTIDPMFGMKLTPKGEEVAAKEANIHAYLGVNNGVFPQNLIGGADLIAYEFYYAGEPAALRIARDPKRNMDLLNWINNNRVYQVPLSSMTAEQMDILDGASDLFVYMDEMMKKFMTGVEPMSNWDAFVKRCDELGMPAVLAVQQARYDAFK